MLIILLLRRNNESTFLSYKKQEYVRDNTGHTPAFSKYSISVSRHADISRL